MVDLLGDGHTAVAEYKVRLQQQAPPPPPPAVPAGPGRTQEKLAQLQKVLGAEHEACQAYAEELRKEKHFNKDINKLNIFIKEIDIYD